MAIFYIYVDNHSILRDLTMKKIIFAMDDYLAKKKAEKAAATKAWKDIHAAKVKAATRGTAGAALAGDGWMEYEEACQIEDDEAKFNIAANVAIAKITAGMSELELSCIEDGEIEDRAVILAKGKVHIRNMHKYMAKPEPRRVGPYL